MQSQCCIIQFISPLKSGTSSVAPEPKHSACQAHKYESVLVDANIHAESRNLLTIMSSKLRKTWAIATDCFDKDTSDFILHAYTIVKFGKDSLRNLDDAEFDMLIAWLEEMPE